MFNVFLPFGPAGFPHGSSGFEIDLEDAGKDGD